MGDGACPPSCRHNTQQAVSLLWKPDETAVLWQQEVALTFADASDEGSVVGLGD